MCISAFKANNDGSVVLRIFNQTDKEITDKIAYVKPISSATEVRIDETPVKELKVVDGKISVTVNPYTIMTVKI